jgi:hypothetical protein
MRQGQDRGNHSKETLDNSTLATIGYTAHDGSQADETKGTRVIVPSPSINLFTLDHSTHTAPWIINITLASRNDMYMTVQDCLASIRTRICADVETAHIFG